MKKKLLLVLFIFTLVLVIPVYAVEKSNFNAGSNIKLTDDINATAFTAGEKVEISSKIEGINFVAGEDITLSSQQDHLFSAGNKITLENLTVKDAFIAGNNITIKDSNIRDLYVTGNNITVSGAIQRNVYLLGENITLNSQIGGDVYLNGENITVGDNTIIEGTLYYPKEKKETDEVQERKIVIADNAKIESIKEQEVKNYTKIFNFKIPFYFKLSIIFSAYLSMLLLALALLKFDKTLFNKIEKYDKNPLFILTTILIGLGLLIGLPILFIFLMLSGIGFSLAILGIIVYIVMIWLSLIPVSYYLGYWLLKDHIDNKYVILSISLLAIYLLRLIPKFNFLIGFILLLFGFGLYFRSAKELIKK